MLRQTDELDAQGLSFADPGREKAPALVTVDHGTDGAIATIDDAHLLFNSDFVRAGNDLHLNGHDGERAIVRDYFSDGERAALMSGEGARLSPDLVDALTKSLAPNQYAQAAPAAPSANDAVGRVVTASADSTVLRNGVPVTVRPGDPVLRADVLQTAAGTMAVTFNDGSTLNLTANTRIVVSEFIYAPNGTGNSQLLDLVQGSLTFISGEVAHSGNMSIGTPVATMGIRGTVGGVTTASDGTVQFYVSQSATGAVIINQQGQIIANVVQDGPLIVVRPVGPLQVVADEIQKSPAQLAVELQALQQIVNIKAIGDQLLQQFMQPQPPNPNPQTPQGGPHTQIPADDKLKITLFTDDTPGGNGVTPPVTHAVIEVVTHQHDAPPPPVSVPIAVNLPPVTFAPLATTTAEDSPLIFSGAKAISVFDNDSQTLTVTLSVTHGVLSLGHLSGLTFAAGDGTGDGTMTFSGSPAAINAALNGLTYTPSQDYNGPAAVSITTTDGNAPPVTTTVQVDVTPVNDAPVLNFFNLNITGNEPVVLTPSDYSVTDPDGPDVIFTVTNVTGGSFVVDTGNNLFSTQSNCNDAVTFTADDIAHGRVKFVPDGSGDPVSYSISVSDGVDSAPAGHVPVAENVSVDVVAGAAASYNLVIILDTSGSMAGQSLADAKAAIQNLLDAQGVTINGVMAASFDNDGHVHAVGGNPWVGVSEAKAYFDALQAGGGTDYESAIDGVMSAWTGSSPPQADKTLVYFISDGEPTEGNMPGLQATWEQFLASHGVDTAHAIGISPNVSATNLAPIAWTVGDAAFPPENLQSTTDLSDALQSTFMETYNLFDETDASFGGDGGRILSITVDGKTYTWDGLNTVSSTSEAQWSATAASVTVITVLGGVVTFYFGDENGHRAGDGAYVPPVNVDHSANEVFRYTLVDNTGDQASAAITVHVFDQDVPQPSCDVVVTDGTALFDIPDWVLLRNDNDPDGFLSVEAVSNAAAPISASHGDDQVTVDLNGLVGGSRTFTYAVSDGEQAATATVSVAQAANLDQSQTTDNSIIVATTGSSMQGGSGDNVLIGSDGSDTMTGNAGADVFVFREGNGADIVTDFSGHTNGGQGDVIALDGYPFSSFADLKQNATIDDIGQNGDHTTLIDFGDGNSITLEHVDPTHLTAADFIFHPQSTNLG